MLDGPIVAAVPAKDRFPNETGRRLFDVLQGISEGVRGRLDAVKISDLAESHESAELKPRKSEKGR